MKVKLNHVGVIKECDVEFIPGINLIVGSSGSGKSTLLRCIYNVASNDFSDSDISFGSNSMKATIELDGDSVEYNRSIRTRGDKCFYCVNGETYTKLGRQALHAVKDVLRINDIEINGEDVNFNFNLQFSSPFLILGSQSTLYNVLTYRSSFDISAINDYYSVDVRNNANEISTNEKLKKQLEGNLDILKEQEKSLSGIEDLYSKYIEYKHELSVLSELKELSALMLSCNRVSDYLERISALLSNLHKAMVKTTAIMDFKKIRHCISSINDINNHIVLLNKLETEYLSANKIMANVISFRELHKKLSNIIAISKSESVVIYCLSRVDSLLKDKDIAYDSLKQFKLLNNLKSCNKVSNILEIQNNNDLSSVKIFLGLADKLKNLVDVNNKVKSCKRKCTIAHNKLAEFGVCPLCGNHLEMAVEELDEVC